MYYFESREKLITAKTITKLGGPHISEKHIRMRELEETHILYHFMLIIWYKTFSNDLNLNVFSAHCLKKKQTDHIPEVGGGWLCLSVALVCESMNIGWASECLRVSTWCVVG